MVSVQGFSAEGDAGQVTVPLSVVPVKVGPTPGSG
jgi:hypothetical protein